MAMSPDPQPFAGVWGPYYGAALPKLWLSEGGQSATGALLDHIIRWHGAGGEPDAAMHARIARRVAELRAVEGESLAARLHVLPDFHGNRSPLADPHAVGVVSGLTLDSSFDSLCKLYWRTAVGIALGVRHVLEALNENGYVIDTLHVTGGHTKNPLLMELYADATGCTVIEPLADEAVLLGTGMVAATAAGLFPDLNAACMAMQQGGRTRASNPGVGRPVRPRLPGFPGDAPAKAGAGRDQVETQRLPLWLKRSRPSSLAFMSHFVQKTAQTPRSRRFCRLKCGFRPDADVPQSERAENVCDRSRRSRAGKSLASGNQGDVGARLADGAHQSRPDRDDRHRRHDDGPAGAGYTGQRRAWLQSLFHAADLRPRPDAGDLADDRHRAWPSPPFGARPAPHRAAGPVAGDPDLHSDLDRALARRGDPAGDGPGTRAGAPGRHLSALAGMGGVALLRLHRAALLHLGAGAAGLGAGHRLRCGGLQCLLQLGVHVRQSRRPFDGHSRLRPCHHAVQHADVRRHGGGGDAGEANSAATICSGASGAPTGRVSRACCGSACRLPAFSPSR